jgi:hypothetical protein
VFPLGERGVERLGGDELPRVQLLLPRVVALGLGEQRADLPLLRARGVQLGARERELRPGLGVVEPGQHRTLLHPLPLLDQHLGDLAGDLGRDRGLAARGDVAAGVEDGAGAGRRGCGARRDRAHRGRDHPGPDEPGPDREREQRERDPAEPAPA